MGQQYHGIPRDFFPRGADVSWATLRATLSVFSTIAKQLEVSHESVIRG